MVLLNSLRLRNKLLLGFSIPVVLIAALSAMVSYNLNRLKAAYDWVEHTHTAIEYGDTLLESMVDMETGLRGYLIAGEASFLKPYQDGQQVFVDSLELALKHVADNPTQVNRLEGIMELKSRWLTQHAIPALSLREEVSAGQAIDEQFRVLSARTVGKDKFDAFRAVIAELETLFSSADDAEPRALAKEILLSMINQETGQRGFLLTGLETSLEPYIQGQKDFDNLVIELSGILNTRIDQASRDAQQLLIQANALSKDWASAAAEPEISIRRQKNEYPRTISDVALFIGKGLGKKSMDVLRKDVGLFTGAERDLIGVRQAEAQTLKNLTSNVALFGALIAALGSLGVVLLITRNISQQLGTEPDALERIASAIADDDLTQNLVSDKTATGVFAAMQTMQENLRTRIEQDMELASDMTRIKQALDSASAAVVVADAKQNIIYQNRASRKLFDSLEADFQANLPGFESAAVVGHSFSSLQKGLGASKVDLDALLDPLEQELEFYSHNLHQVFSPITDESDERLGTVIEWRDRTEQAKVENEIQSVVSAAMAGDLSQRLDMDDKVGFNAMLGDRINALLSVCDEVVAETVRIFNALSRCDLTVKMTGNYQGAFAEVRDHANETVIQLTEVISKVKSDAATLNMASNELSSLNSQTYDTAESSARQAIVVSTAAEQIRANINSVASAGAQMSASIREIARNATEATRIAGDAVYLASSTDTTVRQLSASSVDIGHVIKVINTIAEQTNLLALNATIEAARAGDAGKGFSVVANEVKDLAKETAKATEEIERKVATIQTDSESAVVAIGSIDKIIQEINEIQITTAAAVEQQAATTNEIVRSVTEAAEGSNNIAETILEASTGAEKTLASTTSAQRSTDELTKLAGGLRGLVGQFDLSSDKDI